MRILTFILLTLLIAATAYPSNAVKGKVAIVMSRESQSYRMAADGFKTLLSQKGTELDYDEYITDGKGDGVEGIAGRIRDSSPILVLTLGGGATEGISKHIHDLPVVSGMTLKGQVAKQKSNVTGMRIDFPIRVQLEWLRRIVPDAKVVGVMYSVEENGENMREAVRISRALGLRLVREEVGEASDIPYALKSLIKSSDVIWGVADKVVMGPQTAKHILLAAFRARVPVVGLSKSWTKAGALYSLQPDYSDVGHQCGEIAFRIMAGVNPESIALQSPRKVTYSLNGKAADYMKIEFPETLLKGADEVY